MKNISSIFLLFISAFLLSCSSDEVKSSANFIEKFVIEGVNPVQIIIKDDQNLIHIIAHKDKKDSLSKIDPIITPSENAKYYKSKSDGNWTDEGFFYRVVAEDGSENKYYIKITPVYNRYSFETWDLSDITEGYYIPSDSNSVWASGNAGISLAFLMLKWDTKYPEKYPTRKTSDGYNGTSAVVMETMEGGEVMNRPASLLSGNFFLGNFNIGKVAVDELLATEVGSIYMAKPKKVKGWYKYKEGPGSFNVGTLAGAEPSRPDSCNMSVSFYKAGSLSGGVDTILAVKYIDTSELVIANAKLADCSETEGDDFHPFELDLKYTSEPNFDENHYKIAITFAASRNGDKYAGKFGSKLIIDEVEIEDY